MFLKRKIFLTYRVASGEGIPGMSRKTATNGIMIHHLTLRSQTTSAHTGIYTFLIAASQIARTVRANHAFWSTRGWRPQVSSNTRTHRLLVHHAALAVGTAGRGPAWVCCSNRDRFYGESLHCTKRRNVRGQMKIYAVLDDAPLKTVQKTNAFPDIPTGQLHIGT